MQLMRFPVKPGGSSYVVRNLVLVDLGLHQVQLVQINFLLKWLGFHMDLMRSPIQPVRGFCEVRYLVLVDDCLH